MWAGAIMYGESEMNPLLHGRFTKPVLKGYSLIAAAYFFIACERFGVVYDQRDKVYGDGPGSIKSVWWRTLQLTTERKLLPNSLIVVESFHRESHHRATVYRCANARATRQRTRCAYAPGQAPMYLPTIPKHVCNSHHDQRQVTSHNKSTLRLRKRCRGTSHREPKPLVPQPPKATNQLNNLTTQQIRVTYRQRVEGLPRT